MNEPLQGEEYTDFIRRIRLGDERAAEELIRRYEPEIRLEIRTLLRLRDPRLRRVFDSMDICQSVMVSFFLRAAVGDFDLDEPSQLIRLLVGMARNRLAERVRFHQRHRRDVRRIGTNGPEEWTIPEESESPSEVISRRELLSMFRAPLRGGAEGGRVAVARARLGIRGPRAWRYGRGARKQLARPSPGLVRSSDSTRSAAPERCPRRQCSSDRPRDGNGNHGLCRSRRTGSLPSRIITAMTGQEGSPERAGPGRRTTSGRCRGPTVPASGAASRPPGTDRPGRQRERGEAGRVALLRSDPRLAGRPAHPGRGLSRPPPGAPGDMRPAFEVVYSEFMLRESLGESPTPRGVHLAIPGARRPAPRQQVASIASLGATSSGDGEAAVRPARCGRPRRDDGPAGRGGRRDPRLRDPRRAGPRAAWASSTRPGSVTLNRAGGAEDDPARPPRRARGRRALPGRGRGGRPAPAPQHRPGLRGRRARGQPATSPWSTSTGGSLEPRSSRARRRPAAAAADWSRRWRGPSTTPTSAGSSTAT